MSLVPRAADTAAFRMIGLACAAGGVLGFSLRPLLVKLAYGYGADPIALLALRMLFALPFFVGMGLWAARGRVVVPLSGRDLAAVAGLGFVSYYLASLLDFLGLQYVTAGVDRLILFLYPTIVVALSALFLKRPVTWREAAALLVTYGGLALVMSHSVGGDNADLALGGALVFGGAVAYAVYLVAGSQAVRRIGSMRFTAWAMSVATAACVTHFLLQRPLSALDLPWQVYGLVAVMAVLSTAMPVLLTTEALRRVGANDTALVGALGPVSTIALGWVGLDETMTPLQIAGAALVLGGVLLVSLRPNRG